MNTAYTRNRKVIHLSTSLLGSELRYRFWNPENVKHLYFTQIYRQITRSGLEVEFLNKLTFKIKIWSLCSVGLFNYSYVTT